MKGGDQLLRGQSPSNTHAASATRRPNVFSSPVICSGTRAVPRRGQARPRFDVEHRRQLSATFEGRRSADQIIDGL